MPTDIEKSLVTGGLLMALGVGGLFDFWMGVFCGGATLFGVALLFALVELLRGGRG